MVQNSELMKKYPALISWADSNVTQIDTQARTCARAHTHTQLRVCTHAHNPPSSHKYSKTNMHSTDHTERPTVARDAGGADTLEVTFDLLWSILWTADWLLSTTCMNSKHTYQRQYTVVHVQTCMHGMACLRACMHIYTHTFGEHKDTLTQHAHVYM